MSISEIKQNVYVAINHLEGSRGSEWMAETVAKTYGTDNAAQLADDLKAILSRGALIDPGSAIPIALAAERAQGALGDSFVGHGDTERVANIEGSLIRIRDANDEKNAAYEAMVEKRGALSALIGAVCTGLAEYQGILDTYTARSEEQVSLRESTIGELKASVTGM